MAFKHLPASLLYLAVPFLLASLSFQILHGEELWSGSLNSDSESCDVNVELRSANCIKRGFLAVPQNLYPDIEVLFLKGNEITLLLNSSFERYNHITDLNLACNDIRTVESATLRPLKNLKYLSLAFNYNLVLPTTGFLRWASKLSDLVLVSTGMTSIPNDIFQWSTQLNNTFLDMNLLSVVNISSCDTVGLVDLSSNAIERLNAETFIYACQSEHLNLGRNPIRSVDPDIIASLRVYHLEISCKRSSIEAFRSILIGIARSDVKELRISNSQFTSFPENAFDPLQNVSLRSLDFSSNRIETLYSHIFSNLTRIDTLLLTDNHLQEIEPNYFEGMQDLRKLCLSDNNIKSVNQNSSIWRINLHELYLSRNKLVKIDPETFNGLTNLTILDLSSNRNLIFVKLSASAGLTNLHKIDLSDSGVAFVELHFPMLKSLSLREMSQSLSFFINPEGKFFKHLRSLEYLDLGNNEFFSSDLWDPSLNVSVFDNLTHLTTLDLSLSRFDDLVGVLEPGTFRHLSAIKDLKIDDSKIETLHELVFKGLSSLQNLSLRGNLIKHLHYNLLKVLPQLILINLDNNFLGYLDKSIFLNNPKLRTLLLANNKLNSLNQSTFKPVESSLSLLDLSENQVVCDCNLEWLSVLLKSESLNLKNEETTICSLASLAPFRENSLKDFDPSELCRLKTELFCLIPLVGISLIVIAVLVYHNRWPLRYKFFLLRLAILGYKEMQDARDHNDYEFDLNIIFYDDDEEWIREHLRPALEERLPQLERNVFGDGDLVLGMHYLDSVDYVVSHSYKTVILLSRAAVRDRWFMLKFRTAMDHVSDTQTEFVVVVFLEDIPGEEQPFLARLYLSDGRPYLFWPDDVRGQGYFWNELAKHLTINLRTNDLIPNE